MFKRTGLFTFLICLMIFATHKDQLAQANVGSTVETIESTRQVLDLDLLPILEALLKSAACELPCWAGLQPGHSTIEDVTRWLHTTGFERAWYSFYDFYRIRGRQFAFDDMVRLGERFQLSFERHESDHFQNFDFPSFQISFVIQGDQLGSMTLKFTRQGNWYSPAVGVFSPRRLLSHLSELPQVYFITADRAPFNDLTMIMAFQEQGIYLRYEYTMPHSEFYSDGMCAAIEQIEEIELQLSHPGSNPSYRYFKAQMRELAYSDNVETPEDIWGITTDKFLNTLLMGSLTCFDAHTERTYSN